MQHLGKSERIMVDIPLKKASSGLALPVLGIGTWQIGGRNAADHANDEAEIQALRSALEEGFQHIDTAEMYGSGHTEELVGKAMEGFDRAKIMITDKVWSDHLSYDGVLRAVEGSLARLGTDYLDLYLVHQVHPAADWEGVARAFRKLYDEKVLHHLGVSNFTVNRWQSLERLVERPLEANQVHYNLGCREAELSGVVEYVQAHDKLCIAWRPLQKGTLKLDDPDVLALAGRYGKTPSQIALNYLAGQKQVVAVSTMRSSEHRKENCGAVGWTLAAEDFRKLQRDYPHQWFRSEVVPLS